MNKSTKRYARHLCRKLLGLLGKIVVKSFSYVQLFVILWTEACQASLSFTISRSLLKLMSIESVMAFNHLMHLILCHPLLLLPSIFPSSRSFQMSQLFALGGQSIGVLVSASVLPMNIQDWFPLGWTSWISLQPKGLTRVLSTTTVQKHWFFSTQLSVESNSYIHTWLLEKPKLWLLLAKWCLCFLICCLG